MNDLIGLSDELRSLFLRYLDSFLPLQDNQLMDERRQLLEASGVLHQSPIVEPLPSYPSGDSLADLCQQLGITNDLPEFARCGLFDRESLYVHQCDAIRSALSRDQKHIVVTTGTGSGKTECFLVPLFSRVLDDLQRHRGRVRPRGLRSLLLYPLNALAEDQVTRIREAADGAGEDGAREWLDTNCEDRIFFGRYNGTTPVAGRRGRSGPQNRHRARRRELIEQARLVNADSDLRYFFPSMGTESGDVSESSEMWDRWSMQDAPPDLLITNYSMLNIMLMRGIEASIFDETRDWLENDSEAIFSLVVDELHTYRGTAGTEVAYLLRQFLDRIGLSPDSPQLRIMASSASMDGDGGAYDYLREFFGVSNPSEKFDIIEGDRQRIEVRSPQPLASAATAFENFSNALRDTPNDLPEGTVQDLADELGLAGEFSSNPAGLAEVLAQSDSIAAVQETADEQSNAELFETFARRVFSGSENYLAGGRGLLQALSLARISNARNAPAPLPVRGHLFYRNLFGIWACSDPNCCGEQRASNVGRLYSRPRMRCECGGRVLDLLACQCCGDIFLGGYCSDIGGSTFLVHDLSLIHI